MGVIFTVVSKFIIAYIALLVAAVSIDFFFCNVTSLGIVCTRRGKIIFCHFIAFVNYSCEGGSFWVNYFGGIPVLILNLQDV